MATVKKRILGGRAYYYLEHSVREGKRIRKREKYLGKEVPADIDLVKERLVGEIDGEKWYAEIDEIKKNFFMNRKRMPPAIAEKEMRTFAAKFTYETQRIEGSTITRREMVDLLERGIAPKNKPMNDIREAEAHRDLFYEMLRFRGDLTPQLILDWHWALFRKTKPDIAGNTRKYRVGISGGKFVPPFPVEIYPMLAELFAWYVGNRTELHPVNLAALVHLRLVTIHPFGDGNGRVARLAMNFVLYKNRYPMFGIPYANRSSYYNALERSQVKKNERIFLQWFVKRYIKEHRQYLE